MTGDLRRFFDQMAPEWATRSPDADLMDDLLRQVGVAAGWRVLDLGGGTGALLGPLRRRVGPGGRIGLLDLSCAMLRLAAPAAAATHSFRCCGVAEALPLRPGQWDAVIGMGLYPHLVDRAAALAQVAAALIPGGRVAFVHLLGRTRLNRLHAGMSDAVAQHLLPPADEVAATLVDAGFEITTTLDREDRFLVVAQRR